MSTPKAKHCPRCSQVKPADQFYRRRHGRRLSPSCQPCTRATSRLARQRRRQDLATAERLRAVNRARQRRHRTLGGPGSTVGDAA
jgi:recombinational DNA repair protein (RecF pathway)